MKFVCAVAGVTFASLTSLGATTPSVRLVRGVAWQVVLEGGIEIDVAVLPTTPLPDWMRLIVVVMNRSPDLVTLRPEDIRQGVVGEESDAELAVMPPSDAEEQLRALEAIPWDYLRSTPKDERFDPIVATPKLGFVFRDRAPSASDEDARLKVFSDVLRRSDILDETRVGLSAALLRGQTIPRGGVFAGNVYVTRSDNLRITISVTGRSFIFAWRKGR